MFQENRTDIVLNPCLIVEVLSKSTKDHDRTDKFRYYRSIPEFREYVLIDQYEALVEQYTKTDDNTWVFRTYESDDQQFVFNLINVEMTFEDVYEKADFNLGQVEA